MLLVIVNLRQQPVSTWALRAKLDEQIFFIYCDYKGSNGWSSHIFTSSNLVSFDTPELNEKFQSNTLFFPFFGGDVAPGFQKWESKVQSLWPVLWGVSRAQHVGLYCVFCSPHDGWRRPVLEMLRTRHPPQRRTFTQRMLRLQSLSE